MFFPHQPEKPMKYNAPLDTTPEFLCSHVYSDILQYTDVSCQMSQHGLMCHLTQLRNMNSIKYQLLFPHISYVQQQTTKFIYKTDMHKNDWSFHTNAVNDKYLSNIMVQLFQQLICHCISVLRSSTLHLSAHAWTRWDNDRLDLARMWRTHTFKQQTFHNTVCKAPI